MKAALHDEGRRSWEHVPIADHRSTFLPLPVWVLALRQALPAEILWIIDVEGLGRQVRRKASTAWQTLFEPSLSFHSVQPASGNTTGNYKLPLAQIINASQLICDIFRRDWLCCAILSHPTQNISNDFANGGFRDYT